MVARYTFAATWFNTDHDGKLIDVTFTSTAVDNGNPIVVGPPCSLGSSVTPTSQTWSTTDSGSFECAFSCPSVSGPSLIITYQ
jgi:hypothetical protein